MVIYSVMVIAFTFLYTALIFNPKQMSEDLKRNNGFIPGVKPGRPTADYIGAIMDRITLPGAIFLAFVGIFQVLRNCLGVQAQVQHLLWRYFAADYGGCNIGYLQQIETHLLMRQYDGLMKGGRLQGRQTAPLGGY